MSELEKSLSIMQGILESSIDGILVVNNDNLILYYNNKLIEMWKIPLSLIEIKDGIQLLEYISSKIEKPEGFIKSAGEFINHPERTTLDKLQCHNQQFIESYSKPYKSNNTLIGRIWNFRDVTDRVLMEKKIHFQATHDALTKLSNRESLMNFLYEKIFRSQNDKSSFAIMFFDLDRFKLVNDSFSHLIGDGLLKSVSERIQENINKNDMVARIGGDEFVIVTQNFKSLEDLRRLANKILIEFNRPFKIENHDIIISTSIGISIFPEHGNAANELLSHADAAMYFAKELGGSQVQFYTKKMIQQSLRKLQMQVDLHRAIEKEEFSLYYQPQYNLTENKLASVEALIRWQHPVIGIMLPADFIPLVEESGLFYIISEWVIKTACKQNKSWQDQGLPPIRVAVNITTYEFKHSNFVDMVRRILNETRLQPEYLELELTESIIINTPEATKKIIQLKELGIYITIDDFGAGNSTLSYMRKIPLDRIKIDQSFVKNIAINRADEVIIQAIITMAQNLNLKILAEGVETQKQLEFLTSHHCMEAQGFYFSEPLSASQLEEILKHPNLKSR